MADNPLHHSDEIWKPVPGYPKLEASSLGRIRGITRPGGGSTTRLKVLKGELLQTGYRSIRLGENRQLVHRLVCAAFHGVPTFEDPTVDHLDGDRMNNKPENLEWVTRAENSRRQNAAGRGAPKGEKHPVAKLTDYQAESVFRLRGEGWRVSEIARLLTVSQSLIYGILGGKKRVQARPAALT